MSKARNNVQSLKPYTSARDKHKTGIFLDANENYEQWVTIDWEKIQNLNRYPDPTSEHVRKKLARSYINNLSEKQIIVTSGSDELIGLILNAYVESNEYVMIMDPSYGMYEVQSNVYNKKIISVPLKPDFSLNIEEIKNSIQNVTCIFFCSPNNPTGNLIYPDEIKSILSFYKGLVVIDEAYIEFAGIDNSFIDLIHEYGNVIILRTFSKAWGLAGARIGYALANETIIKILMKIKEPYNVSAVSQEIALQALDQLTSLCSNTRDILNRKEYVFSSLKKNNISVTNTSTNFILIELNQAELVQKKLVEKGIILRDRSTCRYLDNTLRVTIGSKIETKMLVQELKQLI